MAYDRAKLLKLLAEGVWLRTGEVAEVLRLNRRTIHNMILDGRLRAMLRTGKRERVVNPEDVRKYLPPETPSGAGSECE